MVVGVVESAEITKSEICKLRNASKFFDLSSVTFSAALCRFQSRLSRIGLIFSQKNRSDK